jgi:hypothetical protein
MRASLAESPELDEIPIGRLGALTIQRVMTAHEVHHRTGPWGRCSGDFSRVLRVGTDLRPPAALETPESAPATASELGTPLTLHRRSEAADAIYA